MKIKICFSQKPLGHFNQILYVQGYAVTDGAVASNDCAINRTGSSSYSNRVND